MLFEVFTGETKEIFVSGHDVAVTIHKWHNGEGVNIQVHGKGDGGLALRIAGALRWEEADVLLTALAAARSA